ncbi:FadR/GntR family transcriptional regulator [Nocardiopsis coralli]|uniref:FadR/GntR family transcriptional regulator n=1 Tax=Nocardiopsis coralli TaxID=2772213 RepID=UPI002E294710|nr:FadR/GntR family transcriptional regulator [Nocardiopsis coralli]
MTDTGSFKPAVRSRLYEQVIDQLREHVTRARLKTGDRLPSERELSERIGVSRASIKQAIVVLEVQGLVEIRHGGGTYLRTDHLRPEPVSILVDRKRRLPDVLDAREALETKLAELAAQRRTDDDLAALDGALDVMEADIASGELGEDGDHRFHAAITAAARNELLAAFMSELSDQIAETRKESLHQPERPAQSLRQHRDIVDAIRAQDPEAAVAAMRAHLQSVSRVRLLTWQPDDD